MAFKQVPTVIVQEAARLALTLQGPVNTHQFTHMLERIRQEQEEAPRAQALRDPRQS